MEEYNKPHPEPHNSYGETYGKHRETLEFSLSQHQELKNFCNENDIGYASSVWDIKSAHEIVSLKPSMIKIPSATNLNFRIHNYLCENYMEISIFQLE